MNFKNILFVISFAFALPCHSFTGLDFLREQPAARKSGLAKIGMGTALFAGAFGGSDSAPVNAIQCIAALGGGAFAVAGIYQVLVDSLAEDEVKDSLYPANPNMDRFINKIVTNEQFIVGATFAGLAFILKQASEDGAPSETSFALSMAGLSLMGATVASQFNKDYLPQIIDFFNK